MSIEGEHWIEVDNDGLFTYREGGIEKSTLLITRCTQLKKRVKRERDAIEFSGATRSDCDRALAKFCERQDVKLMFQMEEALAPAKTEG